MRYAIVIDNAVVNIIEADEWPLVGLPAWVVEVGGQVQIGWIRSGFDLTAPVVSPELIKQQIVDAVQALLDQTAQTRGYDGIVSLCTYVESKILKFKTEALSGVDWRDGCWATCYQIMADVESGLRAIPTAEQVLSELPLMSWGI